MRLRPVGSAPFPPKNEKAAPGLLPRKIRANSTVWSRVIVRSSFPDTEPVSVPRQKSAAFCLENSSSSAEQSAKSLFTTKAWVALFQFGDRAGQFGRRARWPRPALAGPGKERRMAAEKGGRPEAHGAAARKKKEESNCLAPYARE